MIQELTRSASERVDPSLRMYRLRLGGHPNLDRWGHHQAGVGALAQVWVNSPAPVRHLDWDDLFKMTTTGTVQTPEPSPSPLSMIHEIRRLSGMTYDQLADLIGVTRRSVHYWTTGKTIKPEHVLALRNITSTLRHIDRGTQSANRALLEQPLDGGSTGYDMIAKSNFAEARRLLGEGNVKRVKPPKVDRQKAHSRDLHPDGWLAGLSEEPVVPDEGIELAPQKDKRRIKLPMRRRNDGA